MMSTKCVAYELEFIGGPIDGHVESLDYLDLVCSSAVRRAGARHHAVHLRRRCGNDEGAAQREGGIPGGHRRTDRQRIAVACYAAGIYGEAGLAAPIAGVLWYLGMINGVVVVFNMIPAFPLDGGRVLRPILWQLKGSLRWATRITSSIGSGFGLLLIKHDH